MNFLITIQMATLTVLFFAVAAVSLLAALLCIGGGAEGVPDYRAALRFFLFFVAGAAGAVVPWLISEKWVSLFWLCLVIYILALIGYYRHLSQG